MRRLWIIVVLVAILLSCSDRTAQRYYEKALEMQEQGDAPQALDYLRRAATHARSDTALAAIYATMGGLLLEEGLQEQALEALRQACEADRRLADTGAMACDLRDIANVHRTRENDDSCLYFFHEALQLARHMGDSLLVTDIGSQIAGYYLWHQQYDEARRWLMPALHQTEADNGLHFMAADLYHHTGQTDSARHYCQRLLQTGETSQRQMAHKWLGEMLLQEGHAKEAAWHLEQYEYLTDTLMQETDTEVLHHINALYDYSQREQENARLHRWVVTAIAAIIVLVSVLAAVMLVYSRRRAAYRLKVQQLEMLLDGYHHRDTTAEERQQQILADTPICKHIERLLRDSHQPAMTDEDWRTLEDTIEKTHRGFQKRLQAFYHFSTQELHISLLIKIGISPIGIAQLTAHSKQSVSSSRARLYEKVFGKKGSPAQWDEFILSL